MDCFPSNILRMFQVKITFNDKIHILQVADSEEEFQKTTVEQLKEKFRSSVAEPPETDKLTVVFGQALEDHQTLESYKIKHLDVLTFMMKMDGGGGGGGPIPPDEGIQRTDSMEHLGCNM